MRFSLLLLALFVFHVGKAQPLALEKLGFTPLTVSNCTAVKDQYLSATCWSFSSVSLLESEVMRKGKGEVDLSEMFIARYSMLRKIERHLQLKGSNYFTPGGQFHDMIWVIKNFGIVPEEVYAGKSRGEINHDHGEMDTAISKIVTGLLQKNVTVLHAKQKAAIDSLLNYYYGPVPASFLFKGKEYTTHTFVKDYLGINPDDYVEITSYTHHPFYTKFVLEDKYNWTGDAYWNVPLADFTRITDMALDKGYTVGWDGDAADPDFKFGEGLAYIQDGLQNYSTTQRQLDFETETTLLDHMMHIVGRKKEGNAHWYYVKNSWGDYSNPLGGFLYMREDYFALRTVAIIVNKAAIPQDIRSKLKL